MTVNTNAPFTLYGQQSWVTLTAANTAKDGTGTVGLVFTSTATDGSYLKEIVCRTLGTNVASVARVFLNNGSTNATPANNSLFREQTLPATTVTEVAAQVDIRIPIFAQIKPGYVLNITLGTAVAAGWAFVADGGSYS